MQSAPEDGSTEEGAFSEGGGVGKQKPCSHREFVALEAGGSRDSAFLSSSIDPRARDYNFG